jgi:hypothetical protein
MRKTNANLNLAKELKIDEYFTQYSDIEKECVHYIPYFKDKWIYLPCDTEASNFWKYFKDHFVEYGLKRLTATYKTFDGSSSFRIDYNGFSTTQTIIENDSVTKIDYEGYATTHKSLKGNGDFRSSECEYIFKNCDIVVTNPPFSLFKEFFNMLMKHNKKFLIIGSVCCSTYNNVLPYLITKDVWFGYKCTGGMKMVLPKYISDIKGYVPQFSTKLPYGDYLCSIGNSVWITNLGEQRYVKPLELKKQYNPEEYLMYDNYPAINVDRIKDIPGNYYGLMGVPLSFLTKYNKDQFEVLGGHVMLLNNKRKFFRVIIKRKK